jgi:hypothetical protein
LIEKPNLRFICHIAEYFRLFHQTRRNKGISFSLALFFMPLHVIMRALANGSSGASRERAKGMREFFVFGI